MGLFSKLFGKNDKKETIEQNSAQNAEEKRLAPKEVECKESVASVTEEKTGDLPKKQEEAEEASASKTESKSRSQNGFFEIKKSKDNRYVFNLYAANRVIVATSQIYSSSQAAQNGINSVIANAEKSPIEDNTLKNPTPQSFPKWEIYKDKADQFRFRLYASNGSCICHSQGYTTKASCKNGIESIIRTVKTATVDKLYLSKDN